jgi:hypothetical protein
MLTARLSWGGIGSLPRKKGFIGNEFPRSSTRIDPAVDGEDSLDTAYGSAATLNWLVNEKQIAPHIPVIDKSRRGDGSFSRDDFTFDNKRNVYICAEGKLLTTTRAIGPDHTLRYFALRRDCDACLPS